MPHPGDDIMDRLRGDDQNGLRDLFDAYYRQLVRYSMKLVINQAVAEELVQDVFIRIWENRHTIRLTGSIKAYLYAAVKNRSLNHLKSKYNRMVFVDLDAAETASTSRPAEDDVILGELREAINRAVHSLPPRCRIIFNLSRNAGMSAEEIARHLGISRKTVHAQIAIALGKIKIILKDRWDNIPS